jgi:hypothetical protein
MHLTPAFLDEVRRTLTQLGVRLCRVCDSTDIEVDPRPAIFDVGGHPRPSSDPLHDPEWESCVAVRVLCNVCGHVMLFGCDKFRGPDEEVFIGPAPLR